MVNPGASTNSVHFSVCYFFRCIFSALLLLVTYSTMHIGQMVHSYGTRLMKSHRFETLAVLDIYGKINTRLRYYCSIFYAIQFIVFVICWCNICICFPCFLSREMCLHWNTRHVQNIVTTNARMQALFQIVSDALHSLTHYLCNFLLWFRLWGIWMATNIIKARKFAKTTHTHAQARVYLWQNKKRAER